MDDIKLDDFSEFDIDYHPDDILDIDVSEIEQPKQKPDLENSNLEDLINQEEISEDVFLDDDPDDLNGLPNISLKEHWKIILIIGAILFIVVCIAANKKAEAPKEEPTESELSETPVVSDIFASASLFTTDSISYDTTTYEDYFAINKELFVWDNSALPQLSGELYKSKNKIKVPVSVSTYNKYENGQLIKVKYNIVKINDISYVTNISLGEVVVN